MISNEKEIEKYSKENKIYIPKEYKNENYIYKINGNYIIIITNKNCYTQYTTTYCDCYMYNYENNLISNSYSCSTNNNNPTIAYTYISDSINDSKYIRQKYVEDKSVILIMISVAIIYAILLMKGRK